MTFTKLSIALLTFFIAYNYRSPLFFKIHYFDLLLLLLLSTFVIFLNQKYKTYKRGFETLLLYSICFGSLAFCFYKETYFRYIKYRVLNSNSTALKEFGEHFMVGYTDENEVKTLIQKGLVGGLYITTRNIKSKSKEEINQKIQNYQNLRRFNKLSPLFIATDQEGGSVSRMSPPLPKQPPLSFIKENKKNKEQEMIRYAKRKAQLLSSIGINVNFSPVVDLQNIPKSFKIDLHTRIWERSISNDPKEVSHFAYLYSKTLLDNGVVPVLKHFPGLGSIKEDTHFFTAIHPIPLIELEKKDWLPFFEISQKLPDVFIMLGHVKVSEIDPNYPTSFSKKMIQNIIRKKNQFNGILVSDDFSMGPVFYHMEGVGNVAVRSLLGGLDIILISFDPDLYYYCMYKLLSRQKRGEIISSKIKHSTKRILEYKNKTFSFY